MAELIEAWAPLIARVTLLPSSGGRFEVTLDDELLFSKASTERHPHPGEIHALVAARLGPPVARDGFQPS